ncbi:hypothetical protein F4778DRAFT_561597 [Xylariomycetidae sp. FL2044]|nr:hypothetical protein F4778DRAFT_561597 [Xylariomycetidae sp. FL2044]
MDFGSSRLAVRLHADRSSQGTDKMSTLAMSSPHYPHNFHREFAWQEARPEPSPQPRREHERVALPSIRQAIPELQLQARHDGAARTPSATTSPTSGPFAGTMTPPEYIHSPSHSKRRRLSFDEGKEAARASQIPRLYANSQRLVSGHSSPPPSARAAPEPWANPSRTSPYTPNSGLPSMRSPERVDVRERVEPRPTLPSLPHLNFERGAGEMHRIRSHPGDDYVQESMRRASLAPSVGSSHSMEANVPVAAYRPATYGYGFHHPNRVQSLSVGSVHPFDRAQYSSEAYGHGFHDAFMRIGEFGIGVNGENKQRKRRGNLPKETTDKLRAWFLSHLLHPYPTEDEKQELLRVTGLQMNQISNWFINARRRQLPLMNASARATTEAMQAGRGGDSQVLPSTERLEYPDGKQFSDGEESNFDEADYEVTKRRRVTNLKRGSI